MSIIAVNQCCSGSLGHQSTTCLQGCNDPWFWSRFDPGELRKEVPVSTETFISLLQSTSTCWPHYILRKNPPAFTCAKQLSWICKRQEHTLVEIEKTTWFRNFKKGKQVLTGFQGKTTRDCCFHEVKSQVSPLSMSWCDEWQLIWMDIPA